MDADTKAWIDDWRRAIASAHELGIIRRKAFERMNAWSDEHIEELLHDYRKQWNTYGFIRWLVSYGILKPIEARNLIPIAKRFGCLTADEATLLVNDYPYGHGPLDKLNNALNESAILGVGCFASMVTPPLALLWIIGIYGRLGAEFSLAVLAILAVVVSLLVAASCAPTAIGAKILSTSIGASIGMVSLKAAAVIHDDSYRSLGSTTRGIGYVVHWVAARVTDPAFALLATKILVVYIVVVAIWQTAVALLNMRLPDLPSVGGTWEIDPLGPVEVVRSPSLPAHPKTTPSGDSDAFVQDLDRRVGGILEQALQTSRRVARRGL